MDKFYTLNGNKITWTRHFLHTAVEKQLTTWEQIVEYDGDRSFALDLLLKLAPEQYEELTLIVQKQSRLFE